MIGKAAAGVAAAVVGMLLVCAGAVGIFLTGGADADPAAATSTGCDTTLTVADPTTSPRSGSPRPTVAASYPPVGRWTSTQVGNAAIIIATGNRLGIPVRGWVIAVATAMQESSLHNYGNLGPRNDHDSLGLFQQRPSQGWGTAAQILNPAHAATSFYQHLQRVHGWQTLPLTVAAQAVQRSAFPDAYAKWEQPATTLVHTITGLFPAAAVGCDPDTNDTASGAAATITGPAGWTVPVHGPITSGFHTHDRPHHDGVDIAATRGTLIHAATAGTVTTVACTAHTATGADVGCDTDGNRTLTGLGWYVTITHPGGITTTYSHQLIHPLVDVGQPVAAGDVLGLLGSSGDSSGPHLYFQITVAGTPVDPVPYMAAHHAPLNP